MSDPWAGPAAVDEIVPPAKDYSLIWAVEAQARLEQQSLIRGVISPESMIVTYGESNSGKTFHVVERDLCLSVGRTWYDRECEPGFVLYAAAEGPHSVERRVYAYIREHFTNVDKIPFAILPESLDLFRPAADTEPLIEFIKRTEDRLGMGCIKLTADTVARVMAGGNENSPEDMGAFVRNSDKIRHAINCCVEGVHHSGKDAAKGARGHSSLRAATDTEIEVTNKDGLHVARVTKQRDYAVGDEFAFELRVIELGHDKYGHPITTCVPVWDLEHKPGKKGRGLTRQENALLTMVGEVLQNDKILAPINIIKGAKPPPKPGQFVCPEAVLWALVDRKGGLSDSDKPDTQRRTFKRTFNSLRDKGLLNVYDDYAWLADMPDKGGHL